MGDFSRQLSASYWRVIGEFLVSFWLVFRNAVRKTALLFSASLVALEKQNHFPCFLSIIPAFLPFHEIFRLARV